MRKLLRVLLILFLIVFSLVNIVPVKAQSANATFLLSPSSRSVVVNNTFTVKINMRASSSKQISYGRAILAFDPSELEIAQAIEHSDLFCDYPTDANNYYANNAEGAIMITGISTGTQSCPFPTLTTNDSTFATIVFRAKKTGTAEVNFVYNGEQNDNYSGILDTNSPTQFIMTSPQDGTYTISTSVTPTPTPTPTVPPDLGIDPRVTMTVIATASFILVGFILFRKGNSKRIVTTGSY